MDLIAQYQALARYNTWMNASLYEICARVPDSARKRNRHAFFRSIHGTLNHLLLTDRVQLGRFITDKSVSESVDSEGQPITIRRLDQELYGNFDLLRGQRVRTDRAIEEWSRTITVEWLNSDLCYEAMADGRHYTHPVWWAVTHFFNHQTHHRGQLTTLLNQLGHDSGVTDFMAFIRAEQP
jgi:uncharacterized damage-inducible protein DinB